VIERVRLPADIELEDRLAFGLSARQLGLLGAAAVAAYARRAGLDPDVFVKQSGPALTPEHVGKHIADLASSTDHGPGAYLLTPDGLKEIPQ
jgi:membrane-bound lytic murein transglycosylase MltF